jgi:hypothetical protein
MGLREQLREDLAKRLHGGGTVAVKYMNRPKLTVQLSEADLEIIAWALSGQKFDDFFFSTLGKAFGIIDNRQVNDLYQRLMKEWHAWARQED